MGNREPAATRPRDLVEAPWVCHTLVSRKDSLTFVGPLGEKETIGVSYRAQTNTGEGVRALLLSGVGVGVLPEYLIKGDLRRGALVAVCQGWRWRNLSLYAEMPSAKRRPRRVQLFLAALKEAFEDPAGWGGGA